MVHGVLTASQGLWFFWNVQRIIEQKLSCPPLSKVQEGMGYCRVYAPIMEGKTLMSADSWRRLGGRDRGSHIQGSSVHNQRIERLHRDTTRCCLSSFYTEFDHMDNEGILDLSNDTVNKTVTVLEAKCPLSEDQISILKGEIDPLSNSTNFAVDIYLRTVHCVARILGSSQSHCLKTRGSTPALVFFFFRRGLYAEGSLRFRFAFFFDDDYMLIAFLLLTCPFWHSQTHEHSNDDGEGSENLNTAIGLSSKKRKVCTLLVCDVKMLNFTYYGGCE